MYDMLALIVGILFAAWYFGMVRSARKVAIAAEFKASELTMGAHAAFKAKYNADQVKEMKDDLELLSSF